jgi:hypothetical protein
LGGEVAAGFFAFGNETLMEADWSVALAAPDPIILVPWSAPGDDERKCRFVDLRLGSHLIDEIEEVQGRPALRSALLLLNCVTSPLWTAKCDAWTSSSEQGDDAFDPYEMDAVPGETAFGSGSYIDMLPRDAENLRCFDAQERWLRRVTERLRAIPASAARVELVMRRAQVDSVGGFAVTWFVEGCGATAQSANEAWDHALVLGLAAIMAVPMASFDHAPGDDTMAETGE